MNIVYGLPDKQFFEENINTYLNFLTEEFGFEKSDIKTSPGMYLGYIFKKPELEIKIENDRGPYELFFILKEEILWLRPYMSKYFSLLEILRAIAPEEPVNLSKEMTEQMAQGQLSIEDICSVTLSFYRKMLKSHCLSILQGDYTILELVQELRKK